MPRILIRRESDAGFRVDIRYRRDFEEVFANVLGESSFSLSSVSFPQRIVKRTGHLTEYRPTNGYSSRPYVQSSHLDVVDIFILGPLNHQLSHIRKARPQLFASFTKTAPCATYVFWPPTIQCLPTHRLTNVGIM